MGNSTPEPEPILIRFDSGSEIKIQMPPKKEEPKKFLDRWLERLANPFVVAAVLGLAGTGWGLGSSWVQGILADQKQAYKLQSEIQARVSNARVLVDKMKPANPTPESQMTYFGNTDNRTTFLGELGWKDAPVKSLTAFPEFDQRTLFSLLRELQLVGSAAERKNAIKAERKLVEMVQKLERKPHLDAEGVDKPLAAMERLVSPTPAACEQE